MSINQLQALYGDGLWEIAKADERSRKDKIMHNIAVGGNAAGAIAGPAAIYSAVKNRREGGIPRDVMRGVSNMAGKAKSERVRNFGQKTRKVVRALDSPGGRKAKIAAGAAGAGLIGIQSANMGVDMLSTKILRDQEKQRVSKKLVPITIDAMPVEAVKESEDAKLKQTPERKKAKDEIDFVARHVVSKADEEKRQVYGWVSVTEINGQPVVDRQNDYISIEEIEKAAHDYLTNSRDGGDMHKRRGVSRLIESLVVTPEKKKLLGLPEDTPTGWWCGFQVEDPEVWEMVKNGERPAFSIHGSGKRKVTVM